MVKALVLIETEVGRAKPVTSAIREKSQNGHAGQIVDAEMVTGPYDVVAQVQHNDLDQLGKLITKEIQTISGVTKTTTCLVTNLA